MSNDEQLLPILSFNSPIFFSVNPAQELSDTHKNQFQMLYDNRFGLKDLSVKQIAYSRVGAKHTFNTSFADKGSYYYKERTLNLGYKIKLTPNFNVGLNFNFALIQQNEIRLTTFDLLPSVGVNYEVNSNSQVFFNLKSNFSKIPIVSFFSSMLYFSFKFWIGF